MLGRMSAYADVFRGFSSYSRTMSTRLRAGSNYTRMWKQESQKKIKNSRVKELLATLRRAVYAT